MSAAPAALGPEPAAAGRPARNVLVAGVGGDGVLALSRILAEGALAAGFDVRRSEIHGMSQRGGSVVSELRYGPEVHSPRIPGRGVDVLISLELLEALRHLPRLRPGGVVLAGDQRISPARAPGADAPYPEDAAARIAAQPGARVVPAHRIAVELGEPRAANMVMLGVFAAAVPDIGADLWRDMIRLAFRPALREVNLEAFGRGLALSGAIAAADPADADAPAPRA